MPKRNKRGFTLIELIVVMAIIGILVLLAMPKFLGYTQRARITNIKHDVKVAEDKIEEYLIKYHKLPDDWVEVTKEQLEALKDEKKLYDKEGLVENNVDDGEYKIIKDDFVKTEIRSKLKGTFYANNDGRVYYEDTKAGKPNEDIKEDKCPAITCNYKLIDIPEEFIEKIEEQGIELPLWGEKTEYGTLTYNAYEFFNGKQIFVIFEDGEMVEIVDIQKFIETEGDEEAMIEIGDVEPPTCFQKLDENGKLVECPSNNINNVLCEITSDKNLTFLNFGQMEGNYPIITDINGKTWILETIGYDDYKLLIDGQDEYDLMDIEVTDYKSIYKGDPVAYQSGFYFNYMGLKNDDSLWEFGFIENGMEDRKILENVRNAFYRDNLYILENGDLYYYEGYSVYHDEEPKKLMSDVKDVHILDNARAFDSFFITKSNGDVFGWGDFNSWLVNRDKSFRNPTKVNLDIKELLGYTYDYMFYLTNSDEIKYWNGKISEGGVLLVDDVKEFGAVKFYNEYFTVSILNSNDEIWTIKVRDDNINKEKVSSNVKSLSFSNSTSYINKSKLSYITKDNKVHYTDYYDYDKWHEIDNVSEVLYDKEGFIFKYLDGTIGYIEKYTPDTITIVDNVDILRADKRDDYDKPVLSIGDTIIFYSERYMEFTSKKFSYGEIKDVAIAGTTDYERLFVLNKDNELYELKNDIWVKVGSINSCVNYVFYEFHAS